MLIKMLSTRRVSEDCFVVRSLEEGETYEVRQAAASALISEGVAVRVGPVKSMDEIVADILADMKTCKAA